MPGHIVVCGGGVAGAATALAARAAGTAVTVLEARPDTGDGGTMVRVNPNGMEALRALGVRQAVLARSFPLVRSERVDPDGARLGYRLSTDPAAPHGLPRVMHWSALLEVLRVEAAAHGAVFRHGGRVVDVEQGTRGATAVLVDGDRVTGDVVVGADGVHSRVRRAVDPDAPAPRRLGTRTVYGYAAEPPHEPPPPEVLRVHVGARAFFATLRDVHTGGCFWFTSLPCSAPGQETPETAGTDGLRAEVSGWYDGDGTLAATTVAASERVMSFDDHALEHLPRWHRGRTIVIGDALHVAPPASEQGASMALEDGVQLARCLRDHAEPTAAFAAFERLRRERVEAVVAMGVGGTSRAAPAASVLARMTRAVRGRVATVTDWQRRPPTAGAPWVFDHRIEWDAPTDYPRVDPGSRR